MRGLLHVSGDGLRVVDDETKGLIVDQTIEKVSFCAPDRNHERGFSYICRDGTTRRWMCHGFLASKDSGERLSHAVGCAFAVCLERKQRRDKECGVTMTFDMKNSTFTRSGSFRAQTLTERMLANERGVDVMGTGAAGAASMAVVAPLPKPFNPFAIERPHATPSMMERQGSFRGLGSLGSTSPFKRQMSLRLDALPSTAERQRAFMDVSSQNAKLSVTAHHTRSVSPIPEVVATTTISQQPQPHQAVVVAESVSQLCQEMSQELSLMATQGDGGIPLNRIDPQTSLLLQSAPTSPTVPPSNMIHAVDRVTPMTVYTNSALNGGDQQVISSSNNNNTNNNNNVDSYANNNLKQQQQQQSVITDYNRRLPYTNGTMTTTTPAVTTAVVSPTVSAGNNVSSSNVPMEAVSPLLPNPDQWLGQIVKKSAQSSPSSPPKRSPSGGLMTPSSQSHNNKSLNHGDPFDAEWVAPLTTNNSSSTTTTQDAHNTNPFISPPPPPATQTFQVQL